MRIYILPILVVLLVSCDNTENHSPLKFNGMLENNMILDMSSEHLAGFKWINKPKSFKINN